MGRSGTISFHSWELDLWLKGSIFKSFPDSVAANEENNWLTMTVTCLNMDSQIWCEIKKQSPPTILLLDAIRREIKKKKNDYISHERKVISECLFCPTGLNVSYFLYILFSQQCVHDLSIYSVFSIVNSDVGFFGGVKEIYILSKSLQLLIFNGHNEH